MKYVYACWLLCFVVACNDVHNLDHTSNGPQYQTNQNKCFADLDKLTTYSQPDSCKAAGIFLTVISAKSTTMSTPGGPSRACFITGDLTINCTTCEHLKDARFFGPGSVNVNGHMCQKTIGQLHCPQEAYQRAPTGHKRHEEPTYPGVKSVTHERIDWGAITNSIEQNGSISSNVLHMTASVLYGHGSMSGSTGTIAARDISRFYGTISCSQSCKIITETPIEDFKMTLHGNFDVVLTGQN